MYVFRTSTGCHLWVHCDRRGWGKIGNRAAHVVTWEAANGPLPPGVQLDHLCRARSCVRPEHLQPVTASENMKRTFARYRRTLDRCPDGHPLSEFGLATPEGGMVCLACAPIQ